MSYLPIGCNNIIGMLVLIWSIHEVKTYAIIDNVMGIIDFVGFYTLIGKCFGRVHIPIIEDNKS